MAKLSVYVITAVALLVFLQMAGVATSTGWLLGTMGFNIETVQNFRTMEFFTTIIAAIVALAAVSGVRVGFISAPTTTVFVFAVAALPLAALLGDLVSIVIQLNSTGANWASSLIFLMVSMFTFGYVMALLEWVRGTDS